MVVAVNLRNSFIDSSSSLSLLCTLRQMVFCGDYQPASVCSGVIPHEPCHVSTGWCAVCEGLDIWVETGLCAQISSLPPPSCSPGTWCTILLKDIAMKRCIWSAARLHNTLWHSENPQLLVRQLIQLVPRKMFHASRSPSSFTDSDNDPEIFVVPLFNDLMIVSLERPNLAVR